MGLAPRGVHTYEVRVYACSSPCAQRYDERERQVFAANEHAYRGEWFEVTEEMVRDHSVALPLRVK
jgi:hypothetical protein